MGKTDKESLSSFWDLEALIPKKVQPPRTTHREIHAADVYSEAEGGLPKQDDSAKRTAGSFTIPPRKPQSPHREVPAEAVWEPESGLICRVEIYPIRSGYPVYEQFRRDAEKLYHIKGLPCPKEPFFSFVPQYSQLTRAQLNTYFYWREEVRFSKYPSVDFSYLKLYLYELINLSDILPEEEFFGRMTDLYLAYREVFSQLDSMIPEWLADYCLLHQILPPPSLDRILPTLERTCSLKELFIRRTEDPLSNARILVGFCSSYDYKNSRYAEGDLLAKMDEHIPNALAEVLKSGVSPTLLRGPVRLTLERQTYSGAICIQSLKKRVKVTFDALSHSYEMKALVSEIVKYSENRLRAAVGVKSRLTVRQLPDRVRAVLDGYFDERFPKKVRHPSASDNSETAAYWQYYDAKQSTLSMKQAREIEQESWDTTRRLVETFSQEDSTDVRESVTVTEESAMQDIQNGTKKTDDSVRQNETIPTTDTDRGSCNPDLTATKNQTTFTDEELLFLRDALAGNTLMWKTRLCEPLDAFADRINEKAVELFGDILLEGEDGDYTLIPDYRTVTEELISKYGKSK